MTILCLYVHLFSDRIIVTKTGLQEDDFKITKELRRVKLYYEDLYQIIYVLAQSYSCCMTNCWPAFIRYIKLKSMITECIRRYIAKEETIYDSLETAGFMEKAAEINNITSGRCHIKQQNTNVNKNPIGYIHNSLAQWNGNMNLYKKKGKHARVVFTHRFIRG